MNKWEIGSEFWHAKTNKDENSCVAADDVFFISGRSALDFVIKDIKYTKKAKRAYLPSYCCHTMIEPFIRNGIEVIFYEVLPIPNGGLSAKIDFNIDTDIFFAIDYFGYVTSYTEYCIRMFRDRSKTVIEDVTHSLFSKNIKSSSANYIYGSLRKWTMLYSGGIASKLDGKFSIAPPIVTNKEYIQIRRDAVKFKQAFIGGTSDDKEGFLSLFRKAERLLETTNKAYSIDKESLAIFKHLDIVNLRMQRRKNSEILIRTLKDMPFLEIIYDICNETTPLFVPVLVKSGFRDSLQNYLRNSHIYCPVHWPLSKYHKISTESKKLYDNVLSIVCDQRYSEEDILILADVIKKFRM